MKERILRCSTCVLPNTTPGISFNEEGVCNYCTSYRMFKVKGERKLLQILDAKRNPKMKYECIVNISGGRDSAYTLLKMKKDYGMKVLALNYANPFTDKQAEKNINNMVAALNVDIIRFDHRSALFEACFRNNLKAWVRNPSPAMVPMMCTGCKIIWRDILRIAKRNEITLIVNGGNPYEYTSYKKELLKVSHTENLLTTYLINIKGLTAEISRNYHYLNPKCIPTFVKGYLFGNQYSLGVRLLGKQTTCIDFFHFIQWNEKDILSRIKRELNWDFPHYLESTWRWDCQIGHLKDYMYMKTLGMTEKDDFYAKLVREGLMTRTEALARLKKENRLHVDKIAELIHQLGLSPKYFLT
ncbi:ATPase [candidate division WOR_3 bacterium SM23_42]|uniref:ATPase n=1 Tax=candidate division WOR_3 bacterium SM23_42 TaxID=1703779 RepID=A0A0S8FRG6_UNCW3|nr:MAG: ATPase [candidate division WOR_3 bacterium SM23_42]